MQATSSSDRAAVGVADTVHRRQLHVIDWGRVVVAGLARMLLTAVLGGAFWAAAPMALGWEPTTVMTGSMEPRLHPGDVVVSRPMPKPMLHPGQVLLAEDPDHRNHLRLHRYLRSRKGMFVTKGDGNEAADSTPLAPSAVHGIGFIRVPFVGLPVLWLRTGAWPLVGIAGALLLSAGLLVKLDSRLRCAVTGQCCDQGDERRTGPDGDGDGRSGAGGDGATTVRPAHRRAGRRSRSAPAARERERRPRHRRVAAGVPAALGVCLVVAFVPTQAIAAPFLGTTRSTPSTFIAATAVPVSAVTCTDNTDASITIGWNSSGVAAASFDVLLGTRVLASAPGTARSVRVTTTQLINLGSTSTLQVRTNLGPTPGSWSATSSGGTKVTVLAVLGLTSLRCA